MKKIIFFLALSAFAFWQYSCKHEPIIPFDPGTPIDTASTSGYPCSPDTAYFQNQILPLIKSQCAQAGCHDAISHKEGVYMVDYNHIMQFVKAFQPANSKLIKVITTTQQDDRMPPAPASPLSTTQIDLIKKWINQGALNNGCNENYGNCDTLNITYANTVQKIMNDHCNGCHYKNSTVGGGFDFTTYANVKSSAQSGDLYGSIAYLPGYNKMPKGGSALSTCVQQKILAWIHAGMPQ